jgi:hypothetical protein
MAEAKQKALDRSKYSFVVETDGELSDKDDKRTHLVNTYEFATNDDDGDFVLYLDIEDFFEPTSVDDEPFTQYFQDDEEGATRRYSSYCEGIRHYVLSPCPIRISVKNEETGKLAELFDFSYGRLWLYDSLEEYTSSKQGILQSVVQWEKNKPTGPMLHIYNKCENLKNVSASMGIALYQASGTNRLGIRILVEPSTDTIPEFFESLDYK